jgi:hypothetical protein
MRPNKYGNHVFSLSFAPEDVPPFPHFLPLDDGEIHPCEYRQQSARQRQVQHHVAYPRFYRVRGNADVIAEKGQYQQNQYDRKEGVVRGNEFHIIFFS